MKTKYVLVLDSKNWGTISIVDGTIMTVTYWADMDRSYALELLKDYGLGDESESRYEALVACGWFNFDGLKYNGRDTYFGKYLLPLDSDDEKSIFKAHLKYGVTYNGK